METGERSYKFETLLGFGQFSKVYNVRRRKDWKPYVIKVQQLTDENKDRLKNIEEEIRILDSMKHPNIVSYYGSWKEDQSIYIIMEHATRGTIRILLQSRSEGLSEKDSLYLFSQMVIGLNYIHSQNILHRDIKPENIMLTGRHGDIVQIGDFGLSRHLYNYKVNAGTYNYMSPEIFENRPADFSTDIWSLGVVLYEMITHRLPFTATTYEDLKDKILNQKPEPFNPGISPEMISLISKLLRKDHLRRANMRQLLLCPYLIQYMIQVHLNVGRGKDFLKKAPDTFTDQLFKPFIANNQTIIEKQYMK